MVKDGSLYYGPFPSMAVAERFAGEFLDFFKIRRCVEELNPDPSHPGCIYSQLHMCLAPCFAGCTDAEYQGEVQRVVEFLDSQGKSLLRSLEAERAQASESLEFEQAVQDPPPDRKTERSAAPEVRPGEKSSRPPRRDGLAGGRGEIGGLLPHHRRARFAAPRRFRSMKMCPTPLRSTASSTT